jgi:hypothetical protein
MDYDSVQMSRDLGDSITNGEIDKAINILKELNKMDVKIRFQVTPKRLIPGIEEINQDYNINQPDPPPPANSLAERKREIANQLRAMGFSKEQIEFGLVRSNSAEGAMECILKHFN